MTICWQVLVLLFTSTTVHVTAFVPTGNAAGALSVRLATPQLSEVTDVPRTTAVALQEFGSVLAATVAGQVMLGASVSKTVTDCAQVLLLPPESMTVHVTHVVPTGKLAGASLVTVP